VGKQKVIGTIRSWSAFGHMQILVGPSAHILR
jgi:hypothetical protein